METINGEWIMKGCSRTDPDCLHSLQDCIAFIHKIGFLPLFSNVIPGFSVEEHVPAEHWWCDDAAVDPWIWRMLLAEDSSIAYGKFFNKAAGFLAKDWFPTFANYRRNGYDFDALFEDGLASYRSKKIMDVFELDDESIGKEWMTFDVKTLAGFGKRSDGSAGEQGFEGSITELQMQTYLIMSRFAQKRNKKGNAYGWHIAALETPETKWGREFVTSEYKAEPAKSWERIKNRIKEFFPEAEERQIQKILGIRYPGEIATQKKSEHTEEKKERKKTRPQELPWPENLMTEIGLSLVFPDTSLYQELNNDQLAGLLQVIATLKENEQNVLRLRFKEHKTLQETADVFELSKERIRQILKKAVRKLKHPTRLVYYRDGYQSTLDKREKQKKDIRAVKDQEKKMELLKDVGIMECGLSAGTRIALGIEGLQNLGDIAYIMKKNPLELVKSGRLHDDLLLEVVKKLEDYGVDCSGGRMAYGFDAEHQETVMELAPSMRLMRILLREGYDTINKVKALIENNPEKLLHIDGLGEKTREELFLMLEKRGINCDKARAVCNQV